MTMLFYVNKTPKDKELHKEIMKFLDEDAETLKEAEELKLDVSRYHYLKNKLKDAKYKILDSGGHFGFFKDGVFHEPKGPVHLFEDAGLAQLAFRVHILSMMDDRDVARAKKLEKKSK